MRNKFEFVYDTRECQELIYRIIKFSMKDLYQAKIMWFVFKTKSRLLKNGVNAKTGLQ